MEAPGLKEDNNDKLFYWLMSSILYQKPQLLVSMEQALLQKDRTTTESK